MLTPGLGLACWCFALIHPLPSTWRECYRFAAYESVRLSRYLQSFLSLACRTVADPGRYIDAATLRAVSVARLVDTRLRRKFWPPVPTYPVADESDEKDYCCWCLYR
uniref:Putative secreted protein n=1 Tax=Anopheles darlingi TaxID=43151 RepID=A0A2M4D7Q5_ANODA